MSWQDREYAREDYTGGGGRPHYYGSGIHAMDLVTKIIIANVIVYAIMNMGLLGERAARLVEVFGIMQADAVMHGQVWRLFTATYMHAGFMHIFFNMLVLYFFGPLLERQWGGKQFFIVYTLGGIVGNVILTAAGALNIIRPDVFGLGASGSIMGIIGAAAIYYPNAEVLVYFLLPVRLRTVVIVYVLWFVYNIYTGGPNYGGDICHLGGLIVGMWWAKSGGFAWAGGGQKFRATRSFTSRLKERVADWRAKGSQGSSFRDYVQQRKVDAETVDRILAKVYDRGVHSLTPEERKALTEASERMKKDDAKHSRSNRL